MGRLPSLQQPRPLEPGARIALVAPSGPLRDADLDHALANARSFGWEPVTGDHVLDHREYLAGRDEDRVADLNRFARDDSIDAIWCIRGGYGAMRLLEAIDYDAWRRHPKALIGYSDITALHAAIGCRAGLVTYHGPTTRATLTPFSRNALLGAVTGGHTCGVAPDAVIIKPGRARGRLVGGNLALIAALAGTPFAPPLEDAILVLEDVNEVVYRLDRMFTQLRLSGALERVAGLAFGTFTDIPDNDAPDARPLSDLLEEVADWCDVPCLANIPMGHIDDQWTIPLGATALLDADARTLLID
jgi:muramoyltetrapeptide carboxypeptidase